MSTNSVVPYFKPAAIRQQNKSKSIYTSFKIFMYFSQILGVLPQKNLTDRVEELTFSWKSWRVYYSIVVMALLGVAVACCFIYWADHGSSINALGKFDRTRWQMSAMNDKQESRVFPTLLVSFF